MTSIRRRKSTAVRAIRATLEAYLPGYLAQLNTDLEAEGAGWRFDADAFGDLHTAARGQGPVHPEDTPFPAVRVVRSPGVDRWRQAQGAGTSTWEAQLWLLLSTDQLQVDVDGSWLSIVAAGLSAADAENILAQAQLDLEDAARWSLTRHGALSGAGVITVADVRTEHELEDTQGWGEVIAVASVMTLTLTQETIWSMDP